MTSRYEWLAGALEEEGIVVTANRRLARELLQEHGEFQVAAGIKAWPTPDIRFVTDWLGELVEGCPLDEQGPIRIDSQNSTVLWERCVEDSLPEPLPGSSGIARQCKQSWLRLHEWCVPLHELVVHSYSAEQKLFATAARKYDDILKANHWVDDAGLPAVVDQLLADSLLTIPGRVHMAGFDRMTPAMSALLSRLEGAGTRVSTMGCERTHATVSTTSLPDAAAELRAAGAWARSQLLENPQLHIAIICPDLNAHASRIARLVREGFVPGWQVGGVTHRNSVHTSVGKTLADFPSIRIALMLLRWVHNGLKSREISVLLRSRAIAGGASGARSRIEQKLRRTPDRLWSASDLRAVLGASGVRADDTDWFERVDMISAAGLHYRESANPSKWAERFDNFLSGVGWPGTTEMDSHEFQLLNRWRALLNEFAKLQRVLPALGFQEAIARLARLASDTVYQPESEGRVLPIVGILEAAGLEFDKIWVTSFDARNWPAPGDPMAYVSRKMQKDYAMPDATPQDSLLFSKRVIDRILHSAAEVILSWPQLEGDIPLQPSPMLEDVEKSSVVQPTDPGWYASALLNSKMVTPCSADPIPPVGEDERISGGAYTVQLHSSDPFSAFANGRLHVNELAAFEGGLSARIRGNAIHAALSDLYAEHPSQTELAQWSTDYTKQRITTAVKHSLASYERHADLALRRIIALEHRRIEKILSRFVAEDLLRDEFQVTVTEQSLAYTGHGIQLALRVDRVDRLNDQSVLIVDYKTGAEKSLVNRADELHDLQLVVYALALQQSFPIGGIAIINLDSKKIAIKAAVRNDDWEERFARWSAAATAAIQGIARGDARINMSLSSDQARSLNLLSRFEELRRDR